ncbi:chemotaxis protein CheA [Desulfogranum japonicum]|uniref:chemotaxis protein CheA n=1 Tax=Desulfogranum japonicum TaxID=231447 RepID=UPI0004155D24|nr:chemotaxis protein CheA [Desulfogranum japonicum]
MSNDELDAARGVFLEETGELLEQLEESLLALEENPDDQDLVGSVFRALHTIKGSGAMFGFDRISTFTHEVETAFELIRSGVLQVNRKIIDLTLGSRDIIREMLDDPDAEDTSIDMRAQAITDQLLTYTRANDDERVSPQEETIMDVSGGALATWRIRFKPPEDLFTTGTDPGHLLDDLRELGDCTIAVVTEDIPTLSELDPERLFLTWEILLTTDKGKDSIEDVFIFVSDHATIRIDLVEQYQEDVGAEDIIERVHRLGEILVSRGDLDEEQILFALKEQKKLGEILLEKGMLSETKIDLAIQEQEHLKKTEQKLQSKRKTTTEASIRVTSSKLDNLVNLVGELVTVQARLSQEANTRNDTQLLFLAEEVERLSNELRDNTMNIRMVPIGTTFGKFRRLVRDLSAELGREVNLVTRGGDTELDKTVIEKLDDPLVHLIRNSLDHGIEPPSVRQAAGKPPLGELIMEAEHSGAYVIIRIKDDGNGIDREKIRKRAIERNLMDEGDVLSDSELYSFIFSPGFSTAQVVSSVSGRGVGMDVVRTNIESLRGSVDVESQEGEGTTVTLKIPLTLAIIEGLLSRVGNESYIIPLANVEECVELEEKAKEGSKDRNLVNLRGELVPYVYLRDHFQVRSSPPEVEQIIITCLDGRRTGFVVDEVVGQHQTVIKNLGYLYRDIREISGATILGDGTLALIIDVSNLISDVRGSKYN